MNIFTISIFKNYMLCNVKFFFFLVTSRILTDDEYRTYSEQVMHHFTIPKDHHYLRFQPNAALVIHNDEDVQRNGLCSKYYTID